MKRILAATISLIIMILIFGQKVSASETDEYYYGDESTQSTQSNSIKDKKVFSIKKKINVFINGWYCEEYSKAVSEEVHTMTEGFFYYCNPEGIYPYGVIGDSAMYLYMQDRPMNGVSWVDKKIEMDRADDFTPVTLKDSIPHYELYDESLWDIPIGVYANDTEMGNYTGGVHYWFDEYQYKNNPYVAFVPLTVVNENNEMDVNVSRYQRVEILWKFPPEDEEHLRAYMEFKDCEYELFEYDPHFADPNYNEWQGIYLGGEYATFDVITGDIRELRYEIENHNGEILNINGNLYILDDLFMADSNQKIYEVPIEYGNQDCIIIREAKRIDDKGNPLYEETREGFSRDVIWTSKFSYDENGDPILDEEGWRIATDNWLEENTNIKEIDLSNINNKPNKIISSNHNDGVDTSGIEENVNSVANRLLESFGAIIEWVENLFEK